MINAVKNDDDDESLSLSSSSSSMSSVDESLQSKEEEEEEVSTMNNSPADNLKKVTKTIGNAVFYVSSLLWTIVGIYFGLGILLNIAGYGYEFRKDANGIGIPRLHIDTIQQMRIDRQFESSYSNDNKYNDNNVANDQIKRMQSTAIGEAASTATEMTTVESLLSSPVQVDN